jgi:opacity protein-like surface antigen
MSRSLIALVAMTAVAHAQAPEPAPAPDSPTTSEPMPPETIAPSEPAAPPAAPAAPEAVTVPEVVTSSDVSTDAPTDMSDQAIIASLGLAMGSRSTAGGLRVAGSYLYQLSQQDWFDGTASFVFGSSSPECFRDRMDDVICDHGLADGYAVEVSANVRRFVGGRDRFWPFARAGIGLSIVRFGGDDVTGIALPFQIGGGLRVSASDAVAIVGQAELDVGIGWFGDGPGTEPQFGFNVSAGVEFRL